MVGNDTDKWLLSVPTPPAPEVTLYCLPFAGGGASTYRGWASDLSPEIELAAAQLPGRENRLGEPAEDTFDSAIEAMRLLIEERSGRPFALFGHSMGGHLAFELARALRRHGGPAPTHLFVSSRRAVDLPPNRPLMGALSDDELLATIKMRYGADVSVADDALYRLMLPTIRADILATETTPYREEPPLDIPITALGGLRDEWVEREGLDAWRRQTTEAFEVKMFDGAHFYLNAQREKVIAYIRSVLL